MHHFLSRNSVTDLPALLASARAVKRDPFQDTELGKNRTLVLLFFNASLRTRLSTQVAARRLGMDTCQS